MDIFKSAADSYKLGGMHVDHTILELARSSRDQIMVDFKIHGQGNLYGDGFAMWLTKQRATPGPVFGSVDKFEGLGVFFDTYKNNRPGTVFPYVMAMNGDGKTPYDKDTDGKSNEVAGCSVSRLHRACCQLR
jgi:mannose-binding lectin 2